MKGFVTGLLCAALLALAPVILADTDNQAEQEAVAKHNSKRSDGSKRVCRYEKTTGSHMRKRICRQQRDWDRITTESRETVERINRQAQGSGVGPADG